MKIGSTVIAALAAATLTTAVADARPWKPTPRDLAIDYSQIMHNRSATEIVLLMWMVPQYVEEVPEAAEFLEDYVILGVVHLNVHPVSGVFSFADIPTLSVSDASGAQLVHLSDEDLPPAMTGVMATLRATMRQAIGQMGEGMHFFAFEAGAVHACAPGRLSIPFAGETYTYDTPIPGCK